LVIGLLPLVNWIPGGHEAPWFGATAGEWLSGGAIAIGLGVVLAILSSRVQLWRPGIGEALADRAATRPDATGWLISLVAFLLYATIARTVYDGRPLLIDEIVQVMQARIFAQGRLYLDAPAHPEFMSILHVVDAGGKWYGQFPPGGPAMLVLGVLTGAAWLVGPLCGAIAVAAFWKFVRVIEPRRGVALGATACFAFAPFTAFMAGSHMNHVPTLMWGVLALLALARVTSADAAQTRMALLLGLSLGMMASIRPVDAAAFAAPAGAWLLLRAIQDRRRVTELAAAGFGLALPVLAVLGYNWQTTGDPFLFGYELLWGKSHALGFHRAPWGFAHTPARGLELINLYFLRLQSYLFESPVPSLLPAAGAMLLARRASAFDRYLLGSAALIVSGYFAYWHDGFYLGPRFFYLLTPVLALWSARFLAEVRERTGAGSLPVRVTVFAYAASAVVAAALNVPFRVKEYRGGLQSMRLDYTAPARDAGVQNGLILVRESWGAQLMARLWGVGVPRSEAEGLYRNVDTCILEEAVLDLERRGVRDSSSLATLVPLLSDSSRLERSRLSPDGTERVLAGTRYSPRCMERILEDRGGYTFLTPIHAADPGTNVYVRDLHERDTLLLETYRGRSLYLLRATSPEIGAPLTLIPLAADSLRAAWARDSGAPLDPSP
jgi:hypothetical protein